MESINERSTLVEQKNTSASAQKQAKATRAFVKQMNQTTALHVNVDQTLIVTTEDKARLVLHEHLKRVERRHGWIAPTGILLTLIVALTTVASFQDFLLPKEIWRAVFLVAIVPTAIWLGRAIWHGRHSTSVDEVICQLAKGQAEGRTCELPERADFDDHELDVNHSRHNKHDESIM